jgi:hypothetical protein
MLSANEHLRSKSIVDLRLLVDNLNKDATSKKEELQLMVGSKYHDFIQSADAINNMRDGTASMAAKLQDFKDGSKSLIQSVKQLLSRIVLEQEQQEKEEQEHQRQNISSKRMMIPDFSSSTINDKDMKEEMIKVEKKKEEDQVMTINFHNINNEMVWYALNYCDIFNAAQLIVVSKILSTNIQNIQEANMNHSVNNGNDIIINDNNNDNNDDNNDNMKKGNENLTTLSNFNLKENRINVLLSKLNASKDV